MVYSLVLHPPPVACEDGPALPPADVRFDAGVRVQVSLHVGLDVEALVAHLARVLHVARVLPLVFFQVVTLFVFLAAA